MESELLVNTTLIGNISTVTSIPTFADDTYVETRSIIVLVFEIIILSVIICCGIVGNTLVVIAVFKVRNLRIVANYFIVSLAVADLTVSGLIMPMALHQEIAGKWVIGAHLCDLWVALDVLTCTSSIWNLCAISVDRFLAINHPIKYAVRRTPTMALMVIVSMWVFCFLISIPALLIVGGFNEESEGECAVNPKALFQIISSMISFYLPCFIVLFVYYKIFRSVQALGKRRPGEKVPMDKKIVREPASRGDTINPATMATQLEENDRLKVEPIQNGSNSIHEHSTNDASVVKTGNSEGKPKPKHSIGKKISVAKERRATSVLAIVVTVFICCWLPFFITNVLWGVCPNCGISFDVFNVVTWLGWVNSAANPLIYTIFNREFRSAFRKILTCKINQPSPYNRKY